MRKAVVPVHRIDSDGTIGIKIPDGTWFIDGGKLTNEDIETMASTLFKETSGPDHVYLTRDDTKRIAAAMARSVGIEVED